MSGDRNNDVGPISGLLIFAIAAAILWVFVSFVQWMATTREGWIFVRIAVPIMMILMALAWLFGGP